MENKTSNQPEMISQLKPEYKISNISTESEVQAKRGWFLEINGEKLDTPIEKARLVNPKMGVEVEYGQRQEGYDGFILKEPGGGGSVTIPYYHRNGELFIGVVAESRPTATDGKAEEKVLNVPRGFMDPGQDHFQTAQKELSEETGYEPISKRIVSLPGEPMNPNSTFFVTGKDKGVHMYGVQVYDFEIAKINESENPVDAEYGFDKEILTPTSKIGEKISGSKFIHWTKAIALNDMFSVAGVGRLLGMQHAKK